MNISYSSVVRCGAEAGLKTPVCLSYEPSGALRFRVIFVEEGGRSPHIKIKLTHRSVSTLVHPEMKSS